jgi:uncharacterized protein with GYD domain
MNQDGDNPATFVLISNLTAEGEQRLIAAPDRTFEVNQEIEEMGCRVVSQYALLGSFDFLTVIEAPDNETVALLVAALNSRGAMKVLAMPAFSVADFVGRIKSSPLLAKRPSR